MVVYHIMVRILYEGNIKLGRNQTYMFVWGVYVTMSVGAHTCTYTCILYVAI